jgi:hypothetical protein
LAAESPVETATTRGTASPRACGQAITMTVTAGASAHGTETPVAYHAAGVAAPPPSATAVGHTAARLARSCAREPDSWA